MKNYHKVNNYLSKSLNAINSLIKNDEMIPPSCAEKLEVLGNTNTDNYAYYYVSLERLVHAQNFIEENKEVLSEDEKDIYENQISSKIDALCSKIEFEHYSLSNLPITKEGK
ncbi:hypothetical protein [Lelliottia nimipressuralis]|uniref:Uncharacterized protein n=1 Tax=Lelliottia nimipressuralis TaxID=69220 RepID=A0ABY3NXB8_9ENTR|nr:hypothetical protein [Lelliottia nimipressuralis]RXJ10771.1 hypothetical protein ETG88_19770 [Lelliottia nimipressuralis]TYT29272.1 hypothetical protein FZO59_21050 [Lelliottia nimipressuralis]